MHRETRPGAGAVPSPEEGWWEAVLAEELDGHAPHEPRRATDSSEGKGDSLDARPAPNWDTAHELFEREAIVEMRVSGFNRGGLVVEQDELSGFVPYSHLVDVAGPGATADRASQLKEFVGSVLRLKIIECAREDGRIVFSERAAQAEPGRRAQLFHTLRVGDRVRGTVSNVTDFGAFVDLGGVEGLIHISELSWGRVAHPGKIVRIGESVEVQVLEVLPERCRVALSRKRLQPNPWKGIATGAGGPGALPAVITAVLSYGAFAQLECGVEGLIHVSEIPLADGQSVGEYLHEGQAVQVRILHADPDRQRMGLSMKAAAGS